MRFLFLIASVLFVSAGALAADDAEAVFARFHRAALQGDVEAMLRFSTEAQRARMKIDIDWKEQAANMRYIMPPSYSVRGRVAGASRTVLDIDALGGALLSTAPDKPGRSRGKVTLLREDGEWRIDRLQFEPVIEPNPHQATVRPMNPGTGPMPIVVQPNPAQAVGHGRGAAQPAAR